MGSQTGILREYLHNSNTDQEKLITLSTGHWGLIIIVGLLSLPPIYFAIPICEILGIDKKYAILISLLFLNNFFRSQSTLEILILELTNIQKNHYSGIIVNIF